MIELMRTPLLIEAGAYRHLKRIERDASPEELEKLKARKAWLKKRQSLRFARGSLPGTVDPKELERFGVEPKAPKEHPGASKKHYPKEFTSGTAW